MSAVFACKTKTRSGRVEMRIAPRQLQKGAQATKKCVRVLI
jgi:hypothetical protein